MTTTNFTLRFNLDKETDAKAYQMLCEGADKENISKNTYIKNMLLTSNAIDVDAIATAVAIKVKDMMPMITVANPVQPDGNIFESEDVVISDDELDFISGF